jgi:hypothetical protein
MEWITIPATLSRKNWCVAALPNRTAISNIWQCLIMGCTPGYGNFNFNRLNWWHQTWPYFPRKPFERTVLADKVWESHMPARSVVPRRQGGQGKAPASESSAALSSWSNGSGNSQCDNPRFGGFWHGQNVRLNMPEA